jgi:hypothetical protein
LARQISPGFIKGNSIRESIDVLPSIGQIIVPLAGYPSLPFVAGIVLDDR